MIFKKLFQHILKKKKNQQPNKKTKLTDTGLSISPEHGVQLQFKMCLNKELMRGFAKNQTVSASLEASTLL